MIANLLENGVRYNSAGGTVQLCTTSDNGCSVIRVENGGARIDPAAAHRLAEPFQRLDRNADGRGAGLGLSIVRSVSEAHGGRARPAVAPGRRAGRGGHAPGGRSRPSAAEQGPRGRGAARRGGDERRRSPLTTASRSPAARR